MARRPSSIRPASAWLAAATPATIRKLGRSRDALSAHADAVVETPGEQMRRRHSGLHPVGFRIERAEAHGALEMLDGVVGFAVPDPQKSAEKPGRRQIRIEHHRAVEQGDAGIEIAGEMRQRVAASRQRDRIVAAEFDSPAGQPRRLRQSRVPDRSSSR